jgi:putative two-component system response regulator
MPTTISPRILIVDDEVEITEILADLLSEEYECLKAASAEDALACLREGEFQLVISDITMPGMSGLEMIPHIKELYPQTVVVMISGMQTVESAIGALRLGAFDYLMKPFDLRQVEAVVKRALEYHDLVVAKQRYENHLEELVEQRTAELDQALNSLEDAYRATLKALTTALETRDSETHGHSERVVTYSLRLGREYGLNSEEMKSLEFGSLLHDIGKIGVPDSILRKPGKDCDVTERAWEEYVDMTARRRTFTWRILSRTLCLEHGCVSLVSNRIMCWFWFARPRTRLCTIVFRTRCLMKHWRGYWQTRRCK